MQLKKWYGFTFVHYMFVICFTYTVTTTVDSTNVCIPPFYCDNNGLPVYELNHENVNTSYENHTICFMLTHNVTMNMKLIEYCEESATNQSCNFGCDTEHIFKSRTLIYSAESHTNLGGNNCCPLYVKLWLIS